MSLKVERARASARPQGPAHAHCAAMSAPVLAPAPAAPAATPQLLGLQQPPSQRVGNVRKAAVKRPQRSGKLWASVSIVHDHDTSPQVQCNYCSLKFCGGATRIKEHLLFRCSSTSADFLELKESLFATSSADGETKRLKMAEEEVMALAEAEEKKVVVKSEQPIGKQFKQQGIHASVNSAKRCDIDAAIAEMWYGLNIPASPESNIHS